MGGRSGGTVKNALGLGGCMRLVLVGVSWSREHSGFRKRDPRG